MSESRPRPFDTVLVANRGEIAVRVVRACREAGLRSVACYADPDADAPHTRMADQAHRLPGSLVGETYLNPDALLGVAADSGADAVHPGYGFLSEDATFAEAVIAAGLTWVGPPPVAMRALGDKVSARQIARRVAAPMAPGTDRPVRDADEVQKFAAEHGLPVAIKAAFGGGGRGLRVAYTLAEIPDLFAAVQREAEGAFGRGECFVERYLPRARHVEAQVLADQYGTVAVVGTRDCSLQRRHQKLVEEAPAPFLTDRQLADVTDSAARICREAGYQGAGTVEYLIGDDGTVAFLEVNTRLQVEHPITEETTGLDLVAQQFRIAAGERVDPSLHGLQARGHAVEFRLNCEDPERAFLPAPGRLRRFDLPAGPGVRVDSGVTTDTVVDGQFDSLLAKLIVTGCDRQHTLARARRALAEVDVEGVPTPLSFYRDVLEHPDFVGEGNSFAVHTRWVEEQYLPLRHNEREAPGDACPSKVPVRLGEKTLTVALPGLLSLQGKVAETVRAGIRTRAGSAQPGHAHGENVVSPMQGTVVSLNVQKDQHVSAGDLVAVVEAMKMENPVYAHTDGVVRDVAAKVGNTIAQDTAICRIIETS